MMKFLLIKNLTVFVLHRVAQMVILILFKVGVIMNFNITLVVEMDIQRIVIQIQILLKMLLLKMVI
ncbi:MAG: hypothetical protein EBX27_03905 [Proteobacteria bacterium]|nr:hypothetical protein [Pseudomonadota bacterium]